MKKLIAVSVKVIIIGAGPTGLGAATRLTQYGNDQWVLLEKDMEVGGLAKTCHSSKGYLFDLGGHITFSKLPEYHAMLDSLELSWNTFKRESWALCGDRYIPYPFQKNLWRLTSEDVAHCLKGLKEQEKLRLEGTRPPANFKEFLLTQFGAGIVDIFMGPYNQKVWACDPQKMSFGWVKDRIPAVSVSEVEESLSKREDSTTWGPNSSFKFPQEGGTGHIWKTVARRLPSERLKLGQGLDVINIDAHTVKATTGETYSFDKLISTMPLDQLCQRIITENTELLSELKTWSQKLVYSSVHVVGIGILGSPPEILRDKGWLYFSNPDVPFYRITVFSNYADRNIPEPGRWSLLCEVSESGKKYGDSEHTQRQVIESCAALGYLRKDDIEDTFYRYLDHGYPTPFLERDEVLDHLDTVLQDHGIYSRGRFGAWKYEVSNQDHCYCQGMQAVEHIIEGTREVVRYESKG